MIKVYRVYRYAYRSVPDIFEYERETKCYYVTKTGRKDAKETSYYWTYTSEKEALAHMERNRENIAEAKSIRSMREAAPDLYKALERAVEIIEAEFSEVEPELLNALKSARGEHD